MVVQQGGTLSCADGEVTLCRELYTQFCCLETLGSIGGVGDVALHCQSFLVHNGTWLHFCIASGVPSNADGALAF